eukprot:GHRR01037340.1.p1 GENE.GHRR01037340.1~~GHRR01037340.1.p1  ORF type:complete len:131 (-),score=31.37 GHRR01037340.1:176-568(-)
MKDVVEEVLLANSRLVVAAPLSSSVTLSLSKALLTHNYFAPALQIMKDANAAVPPLDPILDGGSSPEERQASFLELALCLAGGLPDAALDPLFAVSDSIECTRIVSLGACVLTMLSLLDYGPHRLTCLHG